jgi:hypothetical protein
VNTGSNSVGLAAAWASAWLTSGRVAPAVSRSARTALACLILAPTTPTITGRTVLVSGAPSDPRIGARGGHTSRTASFSPVPSDGLTVAGDQRTYHLPSRLTMRTAVTGLQTPTCGSVNRSLTRAPADSPDRATTMRRATKDAREIPSARNA